LTPTQGMNEQKSDAIPQESVVPLPFEIENPLPIKRKHTSILDTITELWHKKTPEISLQLPASPLETKPIENIVSPMSISDIPEAPHVIVPITEKTHSHIATKIAHIFHKQSPQTTPDISPDQWVSETIEIPAIPETPKEPETPFVIDEKFARLLKQDSTYQSMIRSEDLANIQLQLSMRYMLLMLAIFVVIAWVVNNRVIMLWFSDFPFLARMRDALFVILTGLFSLTVWFGSVAWFRHKIGILILRIVSGILFFAVLISIYLPFWG